MDEDEEKKFAELCVKKILNTEPRVEYDMLEMWFDYQALFDKVKCSILEVDNDIEIEHIVFQNMKLLEIYYLMKIMKNNCQKY